MSVAIGPILRAFYNAAVAASATCTVYQSGTTTKVTLYSDAALTTPTTNPVTADSNGEFNFYVDNAYNLRVYLQTSGGTLIKDLDPFYPAVVNVKASNIASASTTDLTTLAGNYAVITGTTTITSLGSSGANREVVVRFAGSLTLTHNASSLVLPGGANITTQSGDIAFFRQDTAGNWYCECYMPAKGDAVFARKGANIASATTTDIGAATGDWVDVTGTTTITSLGNAPKTGARRTVRFTGVLTLTYNATSLILPGSANITTAANDFATFRALDTSGNWICESYTRANGSLINNTISTQDSRTNTVTNALTITATTTGTPANGIGTAVKLQAQSADENPCDFGQIQFYAKDVTSNSEDTACEILLRVAGAALAAKYNFQSTGTANQIFAHANTADRTISLPNTDISQFLVQEVNTQSGAVASGSTTIPLDDTIPQNTEGDQYLSLSITPKSASNILVIDVVLFLANSGNNVLIGALFQDSTANALAACEVNNATAGNRISMSFRYRMVAGTTSTTTFKVRAGGNAGTTTFNGQGGSRELGGVLASSLNIREISP